MLHGGEGTAKIRIKESLDLCRTEEHRIEVEEAFAQLLFDVHDFEGCLLNKWPHIFTNMRPLMFNLKFIYEKEYRYRNGTV